MTSAHAHRSGEEISSGFASFDLDDRLLRGLSAAGFTSPRPIQAATLPAALEGRDILGLAQTGTGKTAAFALPILQRLLDEPGRGPLVLVIAPTRELASQIDEEFKLLARFTGLRTVPIFGGVPLPRNVRALRDDPEIVIGCPGRILDLIRQRALDVSGVDTLVLDEADHMFDMGFLPDIKKILAALPDERQNLLFSATMPGSIRGLADRILREPEVVELAPSAPAEQIEHALFELPAGDKGSLLDHVLDGEDCRTAIVFTRTKHRAKRMAQQLARRGRNAVALQGNMSQSQRERAMNGFRKGEFDVLVATDIAARGIDVAGVDYVINFDPPTTPETYTHRIGRTGRSEAQGKALTFLTRDDRDWLRQTERMLGEPIPRRELPVLEGPGSVSLGGSGGRGEARGGGGRGGSRGAGSRGGAGRRSDDGQGRRKRSRSRGPRSADGGASERSSRGAKESGRDAAGPGSGNSKTSRPAARRVEGDGPGRGSGARSRRRRAPSRATV